MDNVASFSKGNQSLFKRLKRLQKEQTDKEVLLQQNIEAEQVFQRKKKQFIIKTKKELELERQKEKEKQEISARRELEELYEQKQEFEKRFDLLSSVSKQYPNKEEYVTHFDTLQQKILLLIYWINL